MELHRLDIHSMPGHLIRRLNQISVAQFMEQMTSAGLSLTPVQYAALCAIRDHPGIDQASVAGLIAYDRATLGKVIDRLDARKLVRRKVSSSDRRARELFLSVDGQALLAIAHPLVEAAQPEILSGLSPQEQDEFVQLMQKIVRANNELSRAPHRDLGKAAD
ncbi:MarR family winged helix-turn-helix transcriptional regulator [Parasedimentitalea psychrophila]|uniref:MarR family winged helix-turn-helix transcriptional regulator n=1 Tax=Parasedimentitalea psychrophila TaxID=2997337 RepID=A0A9Y2KY71_9RHOB|nr:MarR family winged helix-turn-helix transcriptional regulator [Parasedimentitalea psychrophila]WIY25316.1 MarR family winged helix-turn-helix transcriptional regulator [Parasedimentitalea psychrophila]